MGIDVSSMLMVGCYYEDLPKRLKEKFEEQGTDIHEWLDEHELDYACSYYDCDRTEWYIGFELINCKASDLDKWVETVKDKFVQFEEITRTDGLLMSVPDVT